MNGKPISCTTLSHCAISSFLLFLKTAASEEASILKNKPGNTLFFAPPFFRPRVIKQEQFTRALACTKLGVGGGGEVGWRVAGAVK